VSLVTSTTHVGRTARNHLDSIEFGIPDRRARTAEVWCIFDNTAECAETANALDVLAQVRAFFRSL
jgi:hypothetical protein